jgi:hypothetical protein
LGCAGKVHAGEVKKHARENDLENMQSFQTGWHARIKILKACDRATTVCKREVADCGHRHDLSEQIVIAGTGPAMMKVHVLDK